MTKHTNEKDEKDEKERSKQEEKTVEEKWQRDPLGATIWGLVFIWAGAVLLAENLGLLEGFRNSLGRLLGREPSEIAFLPLGTWSIFFLGVAVLLLIEVVIRLLVPAYRRPVLGTMILAIVFMGLGIGSWGMVLPLILIAAGVALLFGSLWRKG